MAEGLQQIVAKMMSKDPAQRYQTPEAAATVLSSAVAPGVAGIYQVKVQIPSSKIKQRIAEVLSEEGFVGAVRADKAFERILNFALLAGDIAPYAGKRDAGFVRKAAVGQESTLVAPRKVAQVGEICGAAGEAWIAVGDGQQGAAILTGYRERMEEIHNLAAFERSALYVQYANRRFNVAKLIEPQADGGAARGDLRPGYLPQVSDRLSGFRQIGFESRQV